MTFENPSIEETVLEAFEAGLEHSGGGGVSVRNRVLDASRKDRLVCEIDFAGGHVAIFNEDAAIVCGIR